MSVFKDKTLLITGGTGSFGNAVLKYRWNDMKSGIYFWIILCRNKKK